MERVVLITGCAALSIGVVAGALLSRLAFPPADEPYMRPVAFQDQATVHQPAPAAKDDVIAESDAGHQGNPGSRTGDDSRLLAALADTQRTGLPNVPLFEKGERRLSRAFCVLFGLSADEQQVLEQKIHEVEQQLTERQASVMKTSRGAGGEWLMEIESFPEDGGRLRDQLYESIRERVGKDRERAFIALSSSELDAHFAGFGTFERRIAVVPAGVDEKGNAIYSWSEEQTGPTAYSELSSHGNRAEMERRLGPQVVRAILADQ